MDLVDLFESMMMHGLTNPKFHNSSDSVTVEIVPLLGCYSA